MNNIFIFGVLDHDPLLTVILGPGLSSVPAQALGVRAVACQHGSLSGLVPAAPSDRCGGRLLQGLSQDQRARLEFYGAGNGLQLCQVKVNCGGQVIETQSLSSSCAEDDQSPWCPGEWQAQWAGIAVFAAIEAMAYFGRFDGAELAQRMPTIRTRAASRVNALAEERPKPRPGTPEKIEVAAHRYPYAGFFSFQEFDLSYQRFDGSMGPVVTRGALVAQDAVIVLPYDPARRRVLLLEQFRIGPMARGDHQPWALEPVAGMIDPGETARQTAHREAEEEAGLSLRALVPAGALYPSPGSTSEFHHYFIGLCDLPDDAAGLGGLDSEAEDIRTHLMEAGDLFAMTRAGQIRNAPLAILSLWLELNHDHPGLRA